MIQVCFCFSDNSGDYYRHPLVTMVSLFEHSRESMRVHVLCDETLTGDKQAIFSDLCARYGNEIRFYSMQDIPEQIVANISAAFGKGSLYRLFIPDMLSESRVIYLDCDIVVTLDIRELYDLDLGAACLGGVVDAGQHNPEDLAYLESQGIDPACYINSGMLLMDLDKLRSGHANLKDAVLATIAGRRLRYPDQDALHLYLSNHPKALTLVPERFNYVTGIADRAWMPLEALADKIVHYTRGKPWQSFCPAALLYWKYRAKIFPAEECFEAMQALAPDRDIYLFTFLLRQPKIRRMLKRIWQVREQGLAQALLDRIFPSRRKAKKLAAGQKK